MTVAHRILVCDDDDAVRSSLGFLLTKAGYLPNFASKPDDIIRYAGEVAFDLVLLDMNFSVSINGEEGIELLKKIKILRPATPVILMTAWASVELAVRGIKLGASDFVTKPWNNVQLLKIIETSIALSAHSLKAEAPAKKRELTPEFDAIIGNDPRLVEILDVIKRVASTHAPVLITGESGTGKELIASAIHQYSSRNTKPFVKVNLGGIPGGLFESEMFGYRKGAFTDAKSDHAGRFEKANKGTIFLDEIGDLNFSSQVKLLRVLQDQTFERLGDPNSITVDVRILSATNHDLYSLVKKGSFREDLLYRINLIQIEVPPLRKRTGDIPLLAKYFIDKASKTYSVPMRELSMDAKAWLSSQQWPGNVRELKNIIERTLLLAKGDEIRTDDFLMVGQASASLSLTFPKFGLTSQAERYRAENGQAERYRAENGQAERYRDENGQSERYRDNNGQAERSRSLTLDEMEKEMIIRTIEECGGNLTRSSEKLGISRATLYRKMERHGIQSDRNE